MHKIYKIRNKVHRVAHLSTTSLAAGVLAMGVLAGPAWADTPAASAPVAAGDSDVNETVDQMDRQIVVTGTRAAGRTVANSAAPIDVIDTAALKNAAQPDLLQALNTLLPSVNVPGMIDPDVGSIVRAAQLRNLDPSYTLILVDGKRRHSSAYDSIGGFPGSAAPDLALIPEGAISRIEVLRDGASAIYGSDAIAGVINIVLREDTGLSFSTQNGQSYAGDGGAGNIRAGYGLKLGDRGFIRLDGEWNYQDIAIRNSPLQQGYLLYPAINAAGQQVKLGPNNSLPAGDTADPREATRNDAPWINVGVPSSRTGNLSLNARYELTDSINAYAFGTWSHRGAQTAENFRPVNTIFNNNAADLAIYPNGFTPYETTQEGDFDFTVGLKGSIKGWDWDLSNTYGKDSINVRVDSSLNYSLPVVDGVTQTSFYIGNNEYDRDTLNLDVRKSITGLFQDPADLSFGGEYSHEHAIQTAGEPSSYYGQGSSGLMGNAPADSSNVGRHNVAGYVGFSTRPVHPLLVDLAGRLEDYSDFGTNLSGRASLRYDFNPIFAVRGTISNGFHAPALITEAYSQTIDQNGQSNATARPTSAVAQALGATPLKPETSRNITAGFTVTPNAHLRLAVDAYQINVNNRLGESSNVGMFDNTGLVTSATNGAVLTATQQAIITNLLAGAGITPFLPGTKYANGIAVDYYTNVGNTRTRGVDITLDGDNRIGPGTLRWSLAVNFNGTTFTSVAPIPAVLQDLPNVTILSASTRALISYSAPKDKEILGLAYDVGPWTLNLHETRYGPLTRLNSNNGAYYSEPAQFITDINVAWRVNKQVNLTLGTNNLFNQKAPLVPAYARSSGSLAQFVYVYDQKSPVSVLGGFYYLRLGVKL